MAGHVRERGSDHVNVPTAPGAGHEEPVFPWSHADFRHHVLRLVREYVPAIIEELHTIADRSDLVLSPRGLLESQIWPDIDACATRWQLEKPVDHAHPAPHRAGGGTGPRPCETIGSGRPCFLRTAGGPGTRGDAEKQSSIEDSGRRPRAKSKRPSCSTGGRGTTCGTKDTRPSRATKPVRTPSRTGRRSACA